VGDKQTHKTIVVVIANTNPLPATRAREIGLCGHIREYAVTTEVIGRLFAFWETIESPD
jgi:hypothetical protein